MTLIQVCGREQPIFFVPCNSGELGLINTARIAGGTAQLSIVPLNSMRNAFITIRSSIGR